MISLRMGFFVFILYGFYWTSWICRLMSFIKFKEFSAIISWNIFLWHTFFFLPSRTLLTCTIDLLVSSHRFLSLCSFLASHFSLCYSDWIISIDMYSKLVSLLLSPSSEAFFYFSYCIFKSKIAFRFLFISSVSLLKFPTFLFISSVLTLLGVLL